MMGLLSGYLVQLFADAGLAVRDAAWSDNDVLGEWLERQQVKADDAQPLLTRFFGLPYIFGKKCAFAGDACAVRRLGSVSTAGRWALCLSASAEYSRASRL